MPDNEQQRSHGETQKIRRELCTASSDVLALASGQKAMAFWLGFGFLWFWLELALAWPGIHQG